MPSQQAAAKSMVDGVTQRDIKSSVRTPNTATDPDEVQVLPEFNEESGSILANGWKLGKQLGEGMQGAVYALEGKDGKDAGRVLKLLHHKLKAKVTGDLVLLEREWAIGRKLNLLNEDDGFLQGFMQTGSKVLDKDGSLLGIILEKLNGKGAMDRFDDAKFNDIDYILEMVKQALEALDRARNAIGFRHGDMHIRNVMEHRIEGEAGDAETDSDEVRFGSSVDLRGLHFKIIDYGHAAIDKQASQDYEKLRKAGKYETPAPPAISPENLYRAVFDKREDVWRFMRSIGQAAEGRVWHEEDKPKVKLLLSTIRKTTGYKHKAHFARSNESGERRKSFFEQLMSVGSQFFIFKWLHIMLHAYFFPGHPTMTPKEALQYMKRKRAELGIEDWESPAPSS
ncbi:Protein kinase-like superfamily protein [Klebsormidium nitens]|uniref:Protein kinase-like superfamily protein n=1 Tax=Klebsormidium nitens TaxID=105231 RepID=A0A1Y1I7K1_KLENI|nr:Protein kinase-like superfamily protein [Klebsormidium nitens]|eukprot:GAQ86944.1 Protein kinase-like superfamily protein [Klebsormidium nitens]